MIFKVLRIQIYCLDSAKRRTFERNLECNRLHAHLKQKKIDPKINYSKGHKSSNAFAETMHLETFETLSDCQRQSESSFNGTMQGNHIYY